MQEDDSSAASEGATTLRYRKWEAKEEVRTSRLIQELKASIFPLTHGTYLHVLLATLLGCEPMIEPNRFRGSNTISRLTFKRREVEANRMPLDQTQQGDSELIM